uniref:Putative ovule protein n=1 Tax=Solanum chacoense TaxID=4108 RepID=A0A0V0HIR3_SOLCH
MTKERASYIMQLAKFDVVPQYIQIDFPKRRKQQLLSQPAFKFESTKLKIGEPRKSKTLLGEPRKAKMLDA